MLAALSPLAGNNITREENDFSDDNLLESIDFDDLFVGMDMLPGLETDPGEFSSYCPLSGGEDSCEFNNNTRIQDVVPPAAAAAADDKQINNKRKNSTHLGKLRKVKVDWTPELHRRFVQAVEQLGVDKAVPSRILEIMGIGCLTRHNIASHLQKYRSHRKHLLAREAEAAANWSHRRQKYTGGVSSKRAWVAPPSMGFPSPPPPFAHHYRPLHVWGHPSMDSYRPPSSPHAPLLPSWHQIRAPYMPHILPQPRFQIPPPPLAASAIYNGKGSVVVTSTGQSCPRPPLDLHPSKESIDAAIGDILSKPWQPLPLGLRPPALDSVMVELHRQGIQKIPPTCF